MCEQGDGGMGVLGSGCVSGRVDSGLDMEGEETVKQRREQRHRLQPGT